jgi:BlaI family transcriptional regulator, penicillinase repressor
MAGTKLGIEREGLPRPTEAELDILRVLWQHGERTVREVHEALYGSDGAGYTTALKLMQIMHAKGLVQRDDSQRAHVYRAAVSQQRTQKRFMAEMVQRLFNGSPSQLVLHALGDHPRASKAELQQIRDLLNRIDAEKSGTAQSRKADAP